MTNEEFQELREKAQEYIYNVMFEGEFSKEKYQEELKKAQTDRSKLYTDFDDASLNINMEHLVQGYASFGRPFLVAAMSQDLDSATNMFECAIQQCLDLNKALVDYENQLQEVIKTKLAEQANKQKEDKQD